ncbi:MAG: GspE/PulE family protein [Phycisphaerae bacterium]|nr:GspE/PulE family protein [Phycisphaerae bacterium]
MLPTAAKAQPEEAAPAPPPPAAQPAGDVVEFAEVWRPSETAPAWHGPEQILLRQGKVTVDDLTAAAQKRQDSPHLSLLQVLVASQKIDETTAQQAVAEFFELPFVHVTAAEVDENVFTLLPLDYIKAKKVLPIGRQDENVLVALADPADIFLIDDLKRRTHGRMQLVVAVESEIHKAVEELSAAQAQQVDEIIKDISEDTVEVASCKAEEVADLEKIASQSPVIRYANFLISSAVREGASDIHIEPGDRHLRIRYRIDGILFEQPAPPMQLHAAVVSRLKIMANLDIAERRLPQDGRIRATVHERTVDLRVSTLPIQYGEKCVIRILDNRSILVGLENLGMGPETLAAFRHQIDQPHGIILVTGPTGSGKSTTLYSALQVMDSQRRNISTVEDPVEYELSGINQVHVHESIGVTFAAVLRSLLRQDPDIIMVGEIRDEETARIAVQASLTGHLVLSTLHTNDAPASITRLVNIGVEPYLISASVNAVVAQRLVRRICENCKAPVKTPRECDLAYLRKFHADIRTLYQGAGCDKCRQTGYKGRVGVYELLELDDPLRDLIATNPSLTELHRAAHQAGMKTIREDGLGKVAAGITTADELMRVTET